MESIIRALGVVPLAPNTGERIYMREFRKADGLPFDLARWQPTVDAMLREVDTDGPIYLMVDQGLVRAGATHRRPGVHVDGYWHPAMEAHGGGSGGGGHLGRSEPTTGGHTGGRGGSHSNTTPARDPGSHRGNGGGGQHAGAGHGCHITDIGAPLEALILASDVAACRAYIGAWEGAPADGGDCSHIDTSSLRSIILAPNTAYAGNVAMLHESLPVPVDCLRTVVRLNVPGWSPKGSL